MLISATAALHLALAVPAANFAAAPAAEKPTGGASAPARRNTPPMMAWIDPDVEPKTALLCVHGLGLHNDSYKAFGERMAKLKVATYALDVRGFGSWQNNPKAQVVDFDGCLSDIESSLRVIHRAHPGLPVFLLGESMGGAIALRATDRYPELVDGLISCVPSGDRFEQGKTELKVAMKLLGGGGAKKFDIGSSVIKQASAGHESGSVNKDLAEDWLENKLNRKELSPNELMQFQKFMNENHAIAKKICLRPVLIVQGWDDNLVKAKGTLELWEELGTHDKDFSALWGAKHLIFEESQFNDKALNDKADKVVVRWMADHIKKGAGADKPRAASVN